MDLTIKSGRFKITMPVVKTKEEKGKRKLIGIASGTSVDLEDERMAPEAIKSMADSIKHKRIDLRSEHQRTWDGGLGEVTELKVNDKNELVMEAALDKTHKADDLWYHLTEKGTKIGLSVSGEVKDKDFEYVPKLKRRIKTYRKIDLDEISVTSNPAWPKAWTQAIAKSVNWDAKKVLNKLSNIVYKPFPNEHAARQESPTKYARFRRQNDKFGSGIHAIWGITSDGKTEIQSIRFDAKKFTPAEAKAWLKAHDFKTSLEVASKTFIKLTNMVKRIKKAIWDTNFVNNLPDAAFAVIEGGGTKEDGKTKPRSLRHLPHHNQDVKSGTENNTVDIPHLRNALARAPQMKIGESLKNKAIAHLNKHADALLGKTLDTNKVKSPKQLIPKSMKKDKTSLDTEVKDEEVKPENGDKEAPKDVPKEVPKEEPKEEVKEEEKKEKKVKPKKAEKQADQVDPSKPDEAIKMIVEVLQDLESRVSAIEDATKTDEDEEVKPEEKPAEKKEEKKVECDPEKKAMEEAISELTKRLDKVEKPVVRKGIELKKNEPEEPPKEEDDKTKMARADAEIKKRNIPAYQRGVERSKLYHEYGVKGF